MKITVSGLAVLGLALLSTLPAGAQTGSTTRTYTNVDVFGNVTTTTVNAPTSVAEELAQQRLYGGSVIGGTVIGGTTVGGNVGVVGVGSGYYSPYPTYGYGYPAYPYPTYGYGYPAYPAYPYPYGSAYPYQTPVTGTLGVPGYFGPNFTSIPLSGIYYSNGCPPGYGGNFNGGFTGSYSNRSSNFGFGINHGKPSVNVNVGRSSGSTSTTIGSPLGSTFGAPQSGLRRYNR